ncbi:MAG: cellulase family glycosylhydrolase, partial [Fibrobacteres bacterium]|nr:cellulase family glycosylhydrolase [Fibrobacterota bacterium]
NGIKVMLVVQKSDSSKIYPQAPIGTELTFDWSKKGFLTAIPESTVSIRLILGLEKVSGSVMFDNIAIRLISDYNVPPRDSTIPIPQYQPNGILRGAMISNNADSASVVRFGNEWKGNCIRWQLGGTSYTDALLRPDFETLLAQELSKLDRLLPIFRSSGISVVLDMHSLSQGLFKDTTAQKLLIDVWKRLATRYRNSEEIWAYDLANEPNEDSWHDEVMTLDSLYETMVKEIRKIDTGKVIILEPSWGVPSRLVNFVPVGARSGWNFKKIVYSVHCYDPFELTHQGIVGNYPPFGAVYPGKIAGTDWDFNRMRTALKPAVDFQKKYRVPIYIGEFSCVRWANQKSAIRWLTDAVSLFEEYGWDWTYHAYKEFHGWSVEFDDSLYSTIPPVTTDRKELLLSYFALNKPGYNTSAKNSLDASLTPNEVLITPNPFNPVVNIKLPLKEKVSRLHIIDIKGNKIADLTDKGRDNIFTWNAEKFSSGIYILSLVNKSGIRQQYKLTLIR